MEPLLKKIASRNIAIAGKAGLPELLLQNETQLTFNNSKQRCRYFTQTQLTPDTIMIYLIKNSHRSPGTRKRVPDYTATKLSDHLQSNRNR